MRRRTGWDPWRVLRGQPEIELIWARIEGCRERVEMGPNGTKITIDPGASQVDRNALLSHALVHVERGILYPPNTPPAVVEKEEYKVRRESARRMVKQDELIAFVEANQEFVQITAEVVAERFEVPVEVAREAIRQMPAF